MVLARCLVVLFSFGMAASGTAIGRAQDDPPELAELRAKINDAQTTVNARARAAVDAAALLDRMATAAGQSSRQRVYWTEAAELLDRFARDYPTFEDVAKLQFARGVYLWALGRSWARQFEQDASPTAASEMTRNYGESIRVLEPIAAQVKASTEPFAQNVRYRLAQVLADRARLEEDTGRKRTERERAADLLATPITESSLKGHALLLKAELGTDLGLHQMALASLDEAAQQNPAPPAEGLATVRARILTHQAKFAEAIKTLESEPISYPLKQTLAIEIYLGQLREARGAERKEIELKLFASARTLRGLDRADARRGLITLARELAEPEPGLPADAWETLAEGHALLGRSGRAASLLARGADRIEQEGMSEAADRLRYQAAAYHFQADEFVEADALLARILASKPAGPLRPKAGMLRALSLGRALAEEETQATRVSYLQALEQQIREFPDLPVSIEAYWLLARVHAADAKPDLATPLFARIPQGHPRWLAATTWLADEHRERIREQQLNGDRTRLDALWKDARTLLDDRQKVANPNTEDLPIRLLRARLELIGGLGRASDALATLDQALKTAGTPNLFNQVKQLRMVALARLNRWPEAEALIRELQANTEVAAALEIARLLDEAASSAESDLIRRRLGFLLRGWLQPLVDRAKSLSVAQRFELHLRSARAAIFSGDTLGAQRALSELGQGSLDGPDTQLRDLADAFNRMGAYPMVIDIHRARARKLKVGGLPWLDARYALALAYFRAGQPADARQIIDATAILHPELGGGELKSRFEKLRQRLADGR